jgi:hypothetical protein
MSNDRMMIAIGRIERALSRLEALQGPRTETLSQLHEKYAQLRGETGQALAELDQLIGRLKEENHG